MNRPKRALIGTAVSVLLLFSAVPVSAATPVSIVGCATDYVGHNTWSGNILVDAGEALTITETWGAKTRRQINQFLNRTTFKVWFDGVMVPNTAGYWSAPYYASSWWRTTWSFTHDPISEPMVVKSRIVFNQRVSDGTDSFLGKGSLLKCHLWPG